MAAKILFSILMLGVMVHTCNPSTEAGSLHVLDQSGGCREYQASNCLLDKTLPSTITTLGK